MANTFLIEYLRDEIAQLHTLNHFDEATAEKVKKSEGYRNHCPATLCSISFINGAITARQNIIAEYETKISQERAL